MVEFALSSVIMLPLLFGIADFGRLFYASIEVANAAAAGAHYGSRVASNMTDTTGISTAAKAEAPEISSLTVSSSQVCQDSSANSISCGTSGAYQYVKVTTSYMFATLFNYPAIPSSVALSRTVMIRGK
jgi:Flp pilus assembly protein TadG